jgi:hypothetical protein
MLQRFLGLVGGGFEGELWEEGSVVEWIAREVDG